MQNVRAETNSGGNGKLESGMYYYIVDPQKISQKEFERVQNVLYSSLSEYKISGEVVRSTGLRTVNQLVENAFAHEAKTIIAVGSDDTLHEVINAVNNRDAVIGFIPLVESEAANILGVKDIIQAVKTVAFRRIQNLDLGVINDYYFLTKINFEAGGVVEYKIRVNDEYIANQKIMSGIILNARADSKKKSIGDPTDGVLDVLLMPQVSSWNNFWHRKTIAAARYEDIPQTSVLHVKKIEILEPEALNIKIGNRVIAKTPVTISIAPSMLKMIVGRDRNF